MEVLQKPVFQFLEGSGKSFVIPVYQRDYSWNKSNCLKLWNDLVDLNNNERQDHFLGTVVTIGRGFEEYTIIDGQQRLTTISILLIALRNYLTQNRNKDDDDVILSEEILEYLVDKYSKIKEKRIRLKPNKMDKENFNKLFDNVEIEDLNSNIINNYSFFLEKIKSETLTPSEVLDAFKKLKIVLIQLVRGQDDPQLIFESLNSTGVDLTAGDLIRNFILMDLDPEIQEKFYKSFWIPIENNTGNLAEFVRNYLIYNTKSWVKKDNVYSVFKSFSIDKYGKNKENILSDLVESSTIYSYLVQINKHPDSKINNHLERLYRLEFTVSHPFLIDVFKDYANKILTKEDVVKILILIQSYAFRKIIVDNTTQGLNKLFVTLSKDIKKEETWNQNYVDILNYILLEKKVSQRFPSDEEFEHALIHKEIYKYQAKNRNFLLESLENYKSAYYVSLDYLTIEHIMPQTLSRDWKFKLGDNWQEIHKKYLHTLGNLSLTGKNPELSNNSFQDKQVIDYQNSKLKLNFSLDDGIEWNENKIIDRAKRLIKEAIEIWPYPVSSYEKTIPEEQLFDLTSEDSFSGSKPSKLFFDDDNGIVELKSWRDLLINVCKYLYEYSPTEFHNVEVSQELKWAFDLNKPLASALEFHKGHFVEGSLSANHMIGLLKRICERMNYQGEKISFTLKNTTDKSKSSKDGIF